MGENHIGVGPYKVGSNLVTEGVTLPPQISHHPPPPFRQEVINVTWSETWYSHIDFFATTLVLHATMTCRLTVTSAREDEVFEQQSPKELFGNSRVKHLVNSKLG